MAEAKVRYTYRIPEQDNLWEYYLVLIRTACFGRAHRIDSPRKTKKQKPEIYNDGKGEKDPVRQISAEITASDYSAYSLGRNCCQESRSLVFSTFCGQKRQTSDRLSMRTPPFKGRVFPDWEAM